MCLFTLLSKYCGIFFYHVVSQIDGSGQHENVYSLFREAVAGNVATFCTGENYLDPGVIEVQMNAVVYFTVFALTTSITISFLFV